MQAASSPTPPQRRPRALCSTLGTTGFAGFKYASRRFYRAPRTCPQSPDAAKKSMRVPSPARAYSRRHDASRLRRTNRSAFSIKAMSWPRAIASKPPEALQLSGPKLVKRVLRRITTGGCRYFSATTLSSNRRLVPWFLFVHDRSAQTPYTQESMLRLAAGASSGQRPSGVRTPIQLSRTC